VDLLLQRAIEIWGALPELYLLIIFASIFEPSLPLLLILLSLFGWRLRREPSPTRRFEAGFVLAAQEFECRRSDQLRW